MLFSGVMVFNKAIIKVVSKLTDDQIVRILAQHDEITTIEVL